MADRPNAGGAAPLRDGLMFAIQHHLESGAGLALIAVATDCCPGTITEWLTGCTCWVPLYDRRQIEPDPVTIAALALGEQQPEVRDRMCGDCAYRPGSPEKSGNPGFELTADQLEDLAARDHRFWCHDGLRQPTAWQHPAGLVIPAHPDRTGDYQPPTHLGIPYRVDGQPGLVCAGWNARRRALAAAATTDDRKDQ